MNGEPLRRLRTTAWNPPTWNSGRAACHMPSPARLSARLAASADPHRFAQLRGTALGLPVDPDVNMTRARASMLNVRLVRSAKCITSSTASWRSISSWRRRASRPGFARPSARVERAVASAAIVLPENAEWVRDARSGADPPANTRLPPRGSLPRVRGSSPARSVVT